MFLCFHCPQCAWLGRDSLLNKPVEQLSSMSRQFSIETEGIFVQVESQIFGGYIALVRTVYPSLQERIDHMDMR